MDQAGGVWQESEAHFVDADLSMVRLASVMQSSNAPTPRAKSSVLKKGST
jgi:hypothetical protein